MGSFPSCCDTCGFSDARRRRQNTWRRDALMEELFAAHDLNKNGLLEEMELVQLNKKVALLHRQSADKSEVEKEYKELFRTNFNANGDPVGFLVFHEYMLQVLNGVDRDVDAQEMMLEQMMWEAQAARALFHEPSAQSAADLPFLSTISFNKDEEDVKSPSRGRVSVQTTSTEASSF
mmetsp:Transcript_64671/g.152014  ORF Transcript_64671/g.152014 Transcript_64671/m.152014 type:complete len:177 (+) Transcript_64671:46-576(+)